MKSPKIRFKEFQGEWNSRILEDFCYLITKQTGFDYTETIKDALLNKYDKNSYPFIQNKDFEGTNINLNTDFYIPIKIANKFPKIILNEPCILVSISGKIGNIGLYNKKGIAFIGGAVGICRLLKNSNGLFLMFSLMTERKQKYIHNFSKSSSHQNLTIEDVRKFEIRIPSDIKEQEKIGEFFRKIDGILDLENSRFKKLENFKKTMLDKLFVKDGADEPQIRLGSFKGKWNSRILGDICEYRRGSFPQPYGLKQWYDKNGNPFVQVFDVGENFKLKDKTKSNISKLAEPMSVFIPKGSLIVTLQGSIGRVAITHYDAFLDRTLLYFQKFNIKIDLYFFQYVLFLLFQQERQKAPGGTIKTITKEALSSFKIRIPNDIKEQEAIGEFFRKIDGILEFSQKKITKLENIKKYLLNKMFV